MLDRRGFLASTFAVSFSLFSRGCDVVEHAADFAPFLNDLVQLQKDVKGRLGVSLLAYNEKESSQQLYTADVQGKERFALCSTFKFPLAAMILSQGRAGAININEPRALTDAELRMCWDDNRKLLQDIGGKLPARTMAEIAQKSSDNGFANHLLALIGGPSGFTQLIRNMGDKDTRVDRFEPEMNQVLPGEVHDTTTPNAMAKLTAQLIFGDALHDDDRAQLRQWTIDTDTGLNRLRKHLPDGWIAGDKTGSGFNESDPAMTNKYNDVAWIETPDGRRFTLAAYYEGPVAAPEMRDEDVAVLAEVGRIAFENIAA